MTGYRALSFQFVKSFPVLSKGFEIETEMTIHALDKKMPVMNVIVEYRDRPEGSTSKLNTYTDGIKVLLKIVNLYRIYRPLNFFGLICICLFGVTLIMFIPVLIAYLHTGLVTKLPTLIVCGFLMIASLDALFSGIILENMAVENRQKHEIRLLQLSVVQKKHRSKLP